MSDFLVNHAITNVWCDPEQDFQHIFQPTRVTDPRGVIGSFDLLWRTAMLPTSTDRYHVYQLGQVYPSMLGLIDQQSVWLSLSHIATEKLVYIQVYTSAGLMFPLTECYLMFTRDRTLIVAVKEQPTIAPLATTQLYFRFYSNAYYGSKRSFGTSNTIAVGFYRHTTVVAGLQFQNTYTQQRSKPGFTALYLNGNYIDGFLPMQLAVGDVLEYIYDSSVKKVVDFPIGALPTFDSTLDAKRKYLLHYAGGQSGDLSIDYRDDCDLFLFKSTSGNPNNAWNGVYFHKNQNDALRQVTHRDYAVATPYVSAYLTGQPTWGDVMQLTLRLVIRNAGFDRPLTFEAHEIHELYKLQETDLVNAFLGIDSTVDVWRAPNLEASAYVTIMDTPLASNVTELMVEQAYGYNAISKLLGDTPAIYPSTAGNYLELPPALQAGSTMYEYDNNGVLLGHYPHVLGAEYTPVYPGCALVEGIVGNGAFQIDQVFNQAAVTLDPTLSYRFYMTPISGGVPLATGWLDITNDATKYQVVNGVAHWLIDLTQYAVCVKSDKNFLAYELSLSPSNGLMQFSIQAQTSHPTGVVTEIMQIPPGQLDLWLNGNALIENIDYYVTWPQVVLVNKTFLQAGNQQRITVRATGFCNSDLTRSVAEDVSFIRWGVLSHNDRFNLRDDKVIRIIANGRTFHRSQVVFSEDTIEASLPGVPNGAPYQVTSTVVPVRGFCGQDTYALKAISDTTDTAIGNYLTLKIPDVTPMDVDIIPQKYAVYSPFTSTIIHDLINGVISITPFMSQYSDKDVRDALVNYTYLLAYDPISRGVDGLHVDVQPHNLQTVVELTIYQWQFISRAVQIFLQGKVDLSRWISIKQ